MSHHMVELIPLFCHEPTNYTEVFARKRFLIHEIDTACIPESTEGNHALTAATYCKIVFAVAEHRNPLS